MVIPVVSTTLASVDRMSVICRKRSWRLLIDEAGQALPQAASAPSCGRSGSIEVGDAQIPPAVSLPERRTAKICTFFEVDMAVWAAPVASAQTSRIRPPRQVDVQADQGNRRSGCRCWCIAAAGSDVLVSTRIAYAGRDGACPETEGPRRPSVGAGPIQLVRLDGRRKASGVPRRARSSLHAEEAGRRRRDHFAGIVITPSRSSSRRCAVGRKESGDCS